MKRMKEERLKQGLVLCIALYILTLFYSLYINLTGDGGRNLNMIFVACITPLIVPCIFKLFHWKAVYEIYILSTIFTYFASVWGSTLNGYSLPGFDKVLHFTSGWLITTGAVICYMCIKKTNCFPQKTDFSIFLIFINAVNIAVAEFWEFFEYAMLIFFNDDCINHYTQGVHDTITDVMCATLAGALLTGLIVRYYRSGHSNFFVNVYEKFYKRNIN